MATPAEKLNKELEFVRALLASAKTVDEAVAAANAAAAIAQKAFKESKTIQKPVDHTQAGGQTFPITLRNLPTDSEWTWFRVRKAAQEQGLNVARVDKLPGSSWAVVHFPSAEDAAAGQAKLNGASMGGNTVTAEQGEAPEAAAARAERHAKRDRATAGGDGEGPASKRQAVAPPDLPDHICEVVCPWWKRPYSDQLRDKHGRIKAALAAVTEEVQRRTIGAGRPSWVADATAGHGGGRQRPAAPLLGILRAPQIEGYRNKNEFTIGFDTENKPCVGFLLGGMANGIHQVAAADETRHTSRAALIMARAATEYIRDKSKLPAWDKRPQPPVGFWRLLLVREGRAATFLPEPATQAAPAAPAFADLDPLKYLVTLPEEDASEQERAKPHLPTAAGTAVADVSEAEPQCPAPDDLLVLVQVNHTHPAVVSNPALMESELAGLGEALRAAAAAAGLSAPTSMLVQHHNGVANAAPHTAPIVAWPGAGAAAGVPAISDALCDFRFRLSASAFFQVNSPATCVLYKLVSQWAAPGANTVLLDVCCGTGTIGIMMAKQAGQVVGVDNVASGIEDAKANAALNGVSGNTHWVHGRAEEALGAMLSKFAGQGQEVVAVVDPPRAGLHRNVVRGLLTCERLKRLVYVSCNPDSMTENVAQLCCPPSAESGYKPRGAREPDTATWTPFRPVKAMAVDLFPHTQHVECVVLLERS